MRMMNRLAMVVSGALLALSGGAQAQSFGADYGYVGAPMSNFLSSSYLTQQVVNDLATPEVARQKLEAAAQADPSPPHIVSLRGSSRMTVRLAEHYPASQRAEVRALFEQLLRRHASLEDQFGIPHGDLGAAMATMIAGSWMGFHNTSFPDRNFMPLVEQMRAVLASQPGLMESPEADQRDMYDQMAIIGMMLAGTQMGSEHRTDAATTEKMCDAAKGYLQELFKVPADRITIAKNGVAMR